MIKTSKIFLLVSLCIVQASFGQVQWASTVIDYSSEFVDKYETLSWTASQLLGKPNVLPQVFNSRCAWSPASRNAGKEWVEVGFDIPQKVACIAVGESLNGGAISKIYTIDKEGKKHLFYKNKILGPLGQGGRLFKVCEETTDHLVYGVRIELKTDEVKGWNHIDAIGIASKEHSQELVALPNTPKSIQPVERESLGKEINTAFDEVLPVISPDGKTLYFDRKKHPDNSGEDKDNDEIWYSRNVEGIWVTPKRMEDPLNNEQDNFVCSVSPDGNQLLLANHYTPNPEKGVSISTRKKYGWSFPRRVIIEGYQNRSEFNEFRLANDGRTLLMSIEAEGTLGERDIYVSFLQANGNYSKPFNLGKDINTSEKEVTPFLASDGKTLYFASTGYSGYGGFDMYMAKRLDDTWTKWSEPVNLGPSFNTDDWDMAYTIDASGEYAYFVSYKGTIGLSADIFRAKLPEELKPNPVVVIYGTVYNKKTKSPLQAEIHYQTLVNGEEIGAAISDPFNGEYKIVLPQADYYAFWAGAEGFLSESDHVNLTDLPSYQEIERDLYLSPIEIGQTIRLNNIFFEKSKWNLSITSYYELERIAQTMHDNPEMIIELQGHTDIEGDIAENMELSSNRIEAVKHFLVAQGVDEARLNTKAYGGSQPITTKRDRISKDLNRRVELIILKK